MTLIQVYGTFSGNGITESAIANMNFAEKVNSLTNLITEIEDYESGKRVIIKWQYAITNNYSTPFNCYCIQYFGITDFHSEPDTDNLKKVIVNTFNRFSLESNLILNRYEIPITITPITNVSEECLKAVQQLLEVLLPLVEG